MNGENQILKEIKLMRTNFAKYFYFNKLTFVLLILCSFSSFHLHAQKKADLDGRLYNGKFYDYFPPANFSGNQYLVSPKFSSGIAYLQGNKYDNLSLNYDILNQELLLAFETTEGAKRVISISLAYVDSFLFQNKRFVINQLDSANQQIEEKVQLLNLKFYIYYYKKLELQSALGEINYYYSNVFRKTYFVLSGERVEVNSNKSFYKLFDKEMSVKVKQYLNKNKFKIKKMSDIELLGLLGFINSENNE